MSIRSLGLKSHVFLAVIIFSGIPGIAAKAESPIKLKGDGSIQLGNGLATMTLSGTASHLGKYECRSEIVLLPGQQSGSLLGTGVAVFKSANGDLLVGTLTCDFDGHGSGNIAFHWRDSVQFSDGTIVSNTGRFIASRPPGAVNTFHYVQHPLNIIAILIGL